MDFATLLEPGACREYVAMHQHLDVRADDRLLDVACGSGLALELAAARGAAVCGIDASERLVRVARDRLPQADVRVGDMAALPWPDGSFDVVTSFRGLWATTPAALTEAHRVLRPGGRICVTTWGHVKASPGVWALAPLALAAEEKVRAQADMKSLGRPGVGETLLEQAGFVDVRRHHVPFVWEFPDPETFARALASTGPAYEAIQTVGEREFQRRCVEVATERVRDGLPLRAEIDCVGLTAQTPCPASAEPWLPMPDATDATRALLDEDLDDLGFLANVTRLWMNDPALLDDLFEVIMSASDRAGLSLTERGVATITAALLTGDTYCPLAWAHKLSSELTPQFAAAVLLGSDDALDDRSRALAAWTRKVATNPGSATRADVEQLRSVGFDSAQVLQLTLFIGLRAAFSTVNLALGARPEQQYLDLLDEDVRGAWRAAARG